MIVRTLRKKISAIFVSKSIEYTYNEGDIPCDIESEPACKNLEPKAGEDFLLVPYDSHRAYVGLFSVKKVSERWTAMAVLNGLMGTNDYNGLLAGGGFTCQLTKRQSINLMGVNDYIKVGLPLMIIFLIVSLLMVTIIWPI